MEDKEIQDSFSLLYPHTSRQEVMKDERFADYARGKLDGEELSSVYGGYLELVEKIRKEEAEKAISALANRLSSVGSLSNSNPSEDIFFSREQVKAMSRDEIRKNYEKIRKSQEKWQ